MRPDCHYLFFLLVVSQSIVLSELYKVILRNTEVCQDPDPPYENNRSVEFNLTAFNKSDGFYFKGSAIVKRNLSGYYWKIKTGVEISGVIKYTSRYNKLSCKSAIPRFILSAANVRYNEKTCEISKGNYTFNKVDLKQLDRGAYYYPIREIGENVVYFSYYGSSGTAYCLLQRYVVKIN